MLFFKKPDKHLSDRSPITTDGMMCLEIASERTTGTTDGILRHRRIQRSDPLVALSSDQRAPCCETPTAVLGENVCRQLHIYIYIYVYIHMYINGIGVHMHYGIFSHSLSLSPYIH